MMENPVNQNSTPIDSWEAGLLKELAALPRSMQPENDAWGAIANRIATGAVKKGANKNPAMQSWLALAASLMLVAVSSVFILRDSATDQPANQPLAAVTAEPLLLNEWGVRVPANSVELEYQAAFREYLGLNLTHTKPDGLAREDIRQDWLLMQELEQELLAALELEPENLWLAQKLMQLRASQLNFLRAIADSGQLPGRNLI